jgi:hypothetical protein
MKSFFLSLILTLFTKFLFSQSIVYFNDSIYSGDTLELHVTTPVPMNSPILGSCGILHSVYDTTWVNRLTVDLTFDWSGPSLGTCVRRDTVRIEVNASSGIYDIIYFASVFDNNIPPGTMYTRTASDTVQVVVLNATAIAESEVEKLSVFPNPAQEVFTVNGLQNEIEQVELFSLRGQKVREFGANEKQHSLAGVENGIYLLQVVTKNGRLVEKLVISK